MEIYQAVETADFIQLVYDWFDIFNSHLHTFSYPGKVQFIIIIINIQFIFINIPKLSQKVVLDIKDNDVWDNFIITASNTFELYRPRPCNQNTTSL